MSSLLQFSGRVENGRVHLPIYLSRDGEDVEPVRCSKCGRRHPKIYTVARKPAGVWGHWVEFRLLGEIHIPDLSIPIPLNRLPLGAVPMPQDEAEVYWHTP